MKLRVLILLFLDIHAKKVNKISKPINYMFHSKNALNFYFLHSIAFNQKRVVYWKRENLVTYLDSHDFHFYLSKIETPLMDMQQCTIFIILLCLYNIFKYVTKINIFDWFLPKRIIWLHENILFGIFLWSSSCIYFTGCKN